MNKLKRILSSLLITLCVFSCQRTEEAEDIVGELKDVFDKVEDILDEVEDILDEVEDIVDEVEEQQDQEDDIEIESQIECLSAILHPDWIVEEFKNDFTIQFPDTYDGNGMTGFEGNIFRKERFDEKVLMNYLFCGPTWCDDFGETLDTTDEDVIVTYDDRNHLALNLEYNLSFCLNDTIDAILYHNNEASAFGKFYMKQGDEFLESLTIWYDSTEYLEVQNILQTVKAY